MRRFIIAAALLVGACGQGGQSATGCAQQAEADVNWTSETAPDRVIARAEGPSCADAIVVFAIRDNAGAPLWVFASTYHDMTAGGARPEPAPEIAAADVQGFLASWADVNVTRSGDLPPWLETMSRPGEGVATFGYDTPFDRQTYEALRARALPMLCYAAAAAAVQCLIVDPASHTPALIAAYGS